jgi:hypothetical protein
VAEEEDDMMDEMIDAIQLELETNPEDHFSTSLELQKRRCMIR